MFKRWSGLAKHRHDKAAERIRELTARVAALIDDLDQAQAGAAALRDALHKQRRAAKHLAECRRCTSTGPCQTGRRFLNEAERATLDALEYDAGENLLLLPSAAARFVEQWEGGGDFLPALRTLRNWVQGWRKRNVAV